MSVEYFEIVLYFPLGSEIGTLYNFVVDKSTVFDDVWKYWLNIYEHLQYEDLSESHIVSWCDLLGSVSDEIYKALNKDINPLEPDQISRAMALLKIAIKFNQKMFIGNHMHLFTHSIEEIN